MIVVHHLNDSRSERVLWLLEELELPYEIKQYQRDPVTRLAPPVFVTVRCFMNLCPRDDTPRLDLPPRRYVGADCAGGGPNAAHSD